MSLSGVLLSLIYVWLTRYTAQFGTPALAALGIGRGDSSRRVMGKRPTSIEELREALNPMKVPEFEASAIKGVGVFETLKALSKQVLQRLAKQEQI